MMKKLLKSHSLKDAASYYRMVLETYHKRHHQKAMDQFLEMPQPHRHACVYAFIFDSDTYPGDAYSKKFFFDLLKY